MDRDTLIEIARRGLRTRMACERADSTVAFVDFQRDPDAIADAVVDAIMPEVEKLITFYNENHMDSPRWERVKDLALRSRYGETEAGVELLQVLGIYDGS